MKKNVVKTSFIALLFVQSCVAGPIDFQGITSAVKVGDNGVLRVTNKFTNSSGVLKKTSSSTISGAADGAIVDFVDGVFDFNGRSRLTTNYDIFSGTNLELVGSQSIHATEKLTLESLEVSGTSNTLTGSPLFSGDVTLANGSAELDVGIGTKFDANVVLNSGTFKLIDNVSFADGKSLTGAGTINLGKNKLSFGGEALTFSAAVTWENALDITLNAKTTLTSTWTFSNDAVIQGNGNVLDITTSGVLSVASGATLSLTDMYIRGLGTGNFLFADATAIIRLSNVTIEMDAAKTFTTGQVIVDGPVTVITKANTLTFNTNAVLTVDGQTLWYNLLSNTSGGISPTAAGANLTLNNGGEILDIAAYNAILNTIDHGPNNISYSTNTTLAFDIYLSDDHTLTATDDLTLNGNGHKINLANEKNAFINVDATKTLTFENIVIDNLADEHISLGAGASVVFGNGTQVNTMPGDTMNTTWTFGQDTLLCGKGGSITLGGSGQISSTHATGLTLKDVNIFGVSGTNVSCSAGTAKIIFDNTTMFMSANYNFATGFFEVHNGGLEVRGDHTFAYQSTATSTILSDSTLAVCGGATLSYAPGSASQTLLAMTDATSNLRFVNADFNVSIVGVVLTNGSLTVDGKVDFISAATASAEGIHFGNGTLANDLTINIEPASTVNLTSGFLVYDNAET